MKHVQKIFKWLTIGFFIISLFAMTLGQIIPIEFANWKHMHTFYDVIIFGLPFVCLLTLIWTIQKRKKKKINILIGVLTIFIAVAGFFGTIPLMFSFGFSAWTNMTIIYESKENPKVTINHQILDIGAFGYGGKRIVKLTPTLRLWNIVEEIDTTQINKEEWVLVNKEGDLKFP